MGSSRFPGKPLAKIVGMPMIGHVFFRTKMSRLLDEVYIATCDEEISEYAESIGANCIMTKETHERASDRTAEAMLKIEALDGQKVDIVVMIQGDEPMVYPEMIDKASEQLLLDDSFSVVNLFAKVEEREINDLNTVKVVFDKEGFAMYFSREPIPSQRGVKDIFMFKQVPIIPFKRDFLIKFNELEQTPFEIIESVDMLRLLENGYKIKMIESRFKTFAVDTLGDIENVEIALINDPLLPSYTR